MHLVAFDSIPQSNQTPKAIITVYANIHAQKVFAKFAPSRSVDSVDDVGIGFTKPKAKDDQGPLNCTELFIAV